MSLLRTLDQTSAVSTHRALVSLTLLWLVPNSRAQRRSFTNSAVNRPPRLTTDGAPTGDFLIQALVRASSCPEHKQPISTLRSIAPLKLQHDKVRRKSISHKPAGWDNTSQSDQRGHFKKLRNFAEHELKAMVDYYGIEIDPRPEVEYHGDLVFITGDAHEPWPLREKGDLVYIKRLEKLLEDDEAPHDQVFDMYQKLQSPGVVYLHQVTIRALLRHLSIVERPSPIALQRLLSILEDMKTAHIHIVRSEWTAAVHLAGHAMGRVSEDDVQSALHIWQDMEKRARLRGGHVTFNVLFNVAVKAGRYTLAESFLHQIQVRKLQMHRHFRVSLVYYYGVLQNGDGVRKTYQELVGAGDIVDTVVLNAVIAALYRAGEPAAAEQVFERMKRLHASKAAPAPGHRFFTNDWRNRRQLGLVLTYEARMLNRKGDQEGLKTLQDYAPVAPNSRTYAILIRHQASTTGDIDRVHELLQEMRYNSVPLEGTIFIVIFHGFNSFGKIRYSSWTRDKLEKIWTQYTKALRNDLDRTWLSSFSVIAALKAFSKCTDVERTLRAWEELRKLWSPSEEELETVMRALRVMLPNQGLGIENRI